MSNYAKFSITKKRDLLDSIAQAKKMLKKEQLSELERGYARADSGKKEGNIIG